MVAKEGAVKRAGGAATKAGRQERAEGVWAPCPGETEMAGLEAGTAVVAHWVAGEEVVEVWAALVPCQGDTEAVALVALRGAGKGQGRAVVVEPSPVGRVRAVAAATAGAMP